MSFSDWLIIGGTALLVKNGLKKAAADREEAEEEYNRYIADLKSKESELNRVCAVNAKRLCVPCSFKDGLPFEIFEKMAIHASKKIKRINNISVNGCIIYCNVESQTGCSDWDFSVDFNDWGHLTGTYWIKTDNNDSLIPEHYGKIVSGWIHDHYNKYGISLLDFSDFVDRNTDLETDKGLNYAYKENFLKRIFGNSNNLVINYGTCDVVGEHLYPVISMLRESGFKNIKTSSVKDINDKTPGYPYQVEQVVINGTTYFENGMSFQNNSKVLITYHEKQVIRMPFSQDEMRRKNYIYVGDKLEECGFTQIYERKIEDLVTGWIIKDGSVEMIILDDDETRPIEKNAVYDYDQKIVIGYHTKKY